MYWVVMPVHYPNGPQIHWMDFATLAATVSICGLQILEPVPQAQDGAGGRPAFGAEAAF